MKELLSFQWRPRHPPIYIVGLKDDLDNKSLFPTKEMEIEKMIKVCDTFLIRWAYSVGQQRV
jgi:hypothetical protein